MNQFFGAAAPDKESGEYSFYIIYDDGDVKTKNITKEVFLKCKTACDLLGSNPRSQSLLSPLANLLCYRGNQKFER